MKTIAIFAALDTKGVEARFIRDYVEASQARPLVIDVGVLGAPTFSPEVSRAEVATAGGADLGELVRAEDKARAMEAMTRGAAAIAARLHAEGRIDAAIGLGGSAGTTIAASAMRALPIGFPTLIVSTMVSGDVRPYVGSKDLNLMYSVVDVAGLNRISRRILTNAAAAIVGMARAAVPIGQDRPIIAASMFGNTTALVDRARGQLEAAGYEVLVFHATGSGGRTMEALIGSGACDGVYDVTTTEWADELRGGQLSAGPERLDAAARAGLPQVLAPGCLDMINFGEPDSVPAHLRDRPMYPWNPSVTLVRTTPEDNQELGRILAENASRSRGPVAIFLPLRGLSQLDAPGGPFWWPEADQALFDAIRRHATPNVRIVELECNVNDPVFADATVAALLEMLAQPRKDGLPAR